MAELADAKVHLRLMLDAAELVLTNHTRPWAGENDTYRSVWELKRAYEVVVGAPFDHPMKRVQP